MALAAVLSLAAGICLVMWGAGSDPAPTSGPRRRAVLGEPARQSRSQRPGADPRAAAGSTSDADHPAPSTCEPDVIRLGQHQDGTVEVPENPAVAGWFRLGPPPGAAGSSVILGHVDSTSGPAVFFRLDELSPGDRIAVRMDDGTTAHFRVRAVETYRQRRLSRPRRSTAGRDAAS